MAIELYVVSQVVLVKDISLDINMCPLAICSCLLSAMLNASSWLKTFEQSFKVSSSEVVWMISYGDGEEDGEEELM